MTDEEMKRLERMAKEDEARLRRTLKHPGASNREKRRAGAELGSPYGAPSVLALIERVRKAERKGAEEMREKAANEIQASGDIADLAETHGYRELEALVRSIPLPGDAP